MTRRWWVVHYLVVWPDHPRLPVGGHHTAFCTDKLTAELIVMSSLMRQRERAGLVPAPAYWSSEARLDRASGG